MNELIVVTDAALDELERPAPSRPSTRAEVRTLFRRRRFVTGSRAEAEELMQDAFLGG